MDIKFIKQYDTNDLDLVGLLYDIDNNKIRLEVGGTALSTYDIPADELGLIFTPVITAIYVQINGQGAVLDKVSIDSEGAKINGKIVYSKEKIDNAIKNSKTA